MSNQAIKIRDLCDMIVHSNRRAQAINEATTTRLLQLTATENQNPQTLVGAGTLTLNFEDTTVLSIGNITPNNDFTEFTIPSGGRGMYKVAFTLTIQDTSGGANVVDVTGTNGLNYPLIQLNANETRTVFLMSMSDDLIRDDVISLTATSSDISVLSRSLIILRI